MGKAIAIGAGVACLFLALCLACAVVAQASQTWWKIKSNNADTDYYFGLYRFCLNDAINETCYRFDKNAMEKLADRIAPAGQQELVQLESDESKDVWILSFFSIVICGVSFLVSIFFLVQSANKKAMYATIIIQVFLTMAAILLGAACLSLAADKKKDVWPAGVALLKKYAHATGEIDFEGQGFIFQTASSAGLILPFAIYLLLIIPARKQSQDSKK